MKITIQKETMITARAATPATFNIINKSFNSPSEQEPPKKSLPKPDHGKRTLQVIGYKKVIMQSRNILWVYLCTHDFF
jgi:hypothetical protein